MYNSPNKGLENNLTNVFFVSIAKAMSLQHQGTVKSVIGILY